VIIQALTTILLIKRKGFLPSPQIFGFYIFSLKFSKKHFQIQNVRILERSVDFKFNFKMLFFFMQINLPLFQFLKLNLKSMSDSKKIKIWIQEGFLMNFLKTLLGMRLIVVMNDRTAKNCDNF
jgi:hypothetical protein